MKKLLLIAVCGLFLSAFNSMALDRKSGDIEKGKSIFKEQCKSCHNGSDAKKLTPGHKLRSAWKRYLKDDATKLISKHENKDVKLTLDSENINHLWAFCYAGAMDSEKPQTCD